MRVHVTFRDSRDAIEGNTPLKCECVEGRYYCEMPDDLEAFFKLVALPLNRFEVLPPVGIGQLHGADPVHWTLHFYNGHD